MDNIKKVTDPFLVWLYTIGRKETTIEKHGIRFKVLQRNIVNWTDEELQNFIFTKRKEGVANTTINAYLDTIRLYCRYRKIAVPDLKYFNPVAKIKGVLTLEEVNAMINMPYPDNCEKDTHDKWSLFFKCCAYTGARPGEIANLHKKNIDLGNMTFYFDRTKTGIPRRCPIPKIVQKAIVDQYTGSQGHIFMTKTGNIFNDSAWSHAFNKRLNILGIDRPNITLYSLRHSFITTLIEEDVSVYKIAQTVGHSPKQTQSYTHLTTKHMEQTINRHPLVRAGAGVDDVLTYIEDIFKQLKLDSRFNRLVSRNGNKLVIEIEKLSA